MAEATTTNDAGPSNPARATRRKIKAPHPSTDAHRQNVHRRQPPLPPRPSSSHPAGQTAASMPLKTMQGVRTRRTDSTKDGWERDVVFVTRNTPLGALMGRCRSLIMDEGYTRIRLHALAAAIPHALLLLHALLDILPYPRGDRGMWYEIRTGSTECIDEVRPASKSREKGKGKEDKDEPMPQAEEEELDLEGIGGIEADAPERQARLKSSIEIDLHIGPKRNNGNDKNDTKKADKRGPPTIPKRNRASKRKRAVLRRQHQAGDVDEEAAMNEEDEEQMANNA